MEMMGAPEAEEPKLAGNEWVHNTRVEGLSSKVDGFFKHRTFQPVRRVLHPGACGHRRPEDRQGAISNLQQHAVSVPRTAGAQVPTRARMVPGQRTTLDECHQAVAQSSPRPLDPKAENKAVSQDTFNKPSNSADIGCVCA